MEWISRVFRKLLWDLAKELHITPIQIQLLVFISSHKEEFNTVTHLARAFQLTAATVSDTISTLEEKNLLRRQTDLDDRRIHYLKLTSKGKQISRRLSNWERPMLAQLKLFSNDSRERVLIFLMQFIEALKRDDILPEAKTCFSCNYFRMTRSKNIENSYDCILRNVSLKKNELRLDCPNYDRQTEDPEDGFSVC
jgi:DNA-binding MarR family transcriptional regulator